jgi:ABC-type Mn2+/Zn2+ transport system permease subunit
VSEKDRKKYLQEYNRYAYGVSSALGILLVAKSASGESHVLSLIFGNILAVEVNQLLVITIVFPVIL